MSSKAKKIYTVVTTVPIVIIVILAILLVGVRLVGLEPYAVLSGSMEPEYHVGSLIYVKDVDPKELKEGDPVTYVMQGNIVVTHRIIDVIYDDSKPDTIYFQTQGDANDDPDGTLLSSKNVIGKPLFSIPLLGYVSVYIQSPPWSYVTIGVCALFILLMFAADFITGKDDVAVSDGGNESPTPVADTTPADKKDGEQESQNKNGETDDSHPGE